MSSAPVLRVASALHRHGRYAEARDWLGRAGSPADDRVGSLLSSARASGGSEAWGALDPAGAVRLVRLRSPSPSRASLGIDGASGVRGAAWGG